MIDLALIALILAALPAALGAWNLLMLPGLHPDAELPDEVLISILIPARNEAANIGPCLEAALASRGVAVEIVVADDGSEDGTGEIVGAIAARDPRVRLIRVPPLPPGWTGKVHACHRLSAAARGTHLLFIDADVRLAPAAAAAMAWHARTHGLSMVSGVPRQLIGSLGEGLTVPGINLLLLGYLPGGGRAESRLPDLAAACGQLVLCDAAAYRAVGGHEAVRHLLHDGLQLARRFRAAGRRTEVVDGAPLATCRMYRGFGESWAGFVKNAREGMATPIGLPIWTVLLAGAHLWPWALLPAWQAVAALALGFGLRAAVTWRAREPWWTVPLHPLTMLVALAIQWDALLRWIAGRPAGLERTRLSRHKGGMSQAIPESSVAVSATPTRDHDKENFPTASLLLAKPQRAKVMAFYRFVRTADDIGDSPDLPAEDKIARLDAMERALDDPATTMPEARRMHDAGVGVAEARLMLSAFRQDATKTRYADWAELEDYCRRSADPVGRMLLRLHGDGANGPANAAADALCTALQILNHLQDLVPDRAALDRIYLPDSWMALAGGEAGFFDPANTARRREVLDAALDRVEEQLDRASALPRLLRSRRLAFQSTVTIELARRLLAKLRKADPVLGRVALGKADFAAAFAGGWTNGPSDAVLVAARVGRAGSSFARGMAALKGERRRALWGVYAFCRAVDDIADGAMPEAEKRRFLADWRGKLAAPDCALSRELAFARDAFGVPMEECEAMIAGMETDAADRLRLETEAELDLYCRRVAGSVGAMSVRIFGAPEAHQFGLALGHTFQLTNILRDVDEDALRERVYIPGALLAEAGIADGPARDIVAHPRFAAICAGLAARARTGFETAEREITTFDATALLPARVMMWGYHRLFLRMMARGWAGDRTRPRLTLAEKLRMAVMALGWAK